MNKNEHWKIEIIRNCLKNIDKNAIVTRNEKRDIERTIYYYKLGEEFERERILKLIDNVLNTRRFQVNFALEEKDERIMAHLHTSINKFEEEIKDLIGEKDERN